MRLAVEGQTGPGVNWANIFWILSTTGIVATPTQRTDMCHWFYDAYVARIFALQSSTGTVQRVVMNFYGQSPGQYAASYSEDTSGGGDSDVVPDSLSACISWAFDSTWRGGKPRTYLPCLPGSAIATQNDMDSGYQSDVEAGAAALITDVSGHTGSGYGTLQLGLMSFYSGNAPRTDGLFFPYSGAVVHPRFDTQRRRLGREFA